MAQERIASITRETKETQISLKINLDGKGNVSIDTGIPFLDHMLDAFARHGLFDLEVRAKGDLDVDYHHLVEDIGIVLGQAVKQALDDKKGIRRYGFFILPMDEALSRVAIDLCNRTFFIYDVKIPVRFVRDFNVMLFKEFYQGFADTLGANLHMKLEYGEEPHHVAESMIKCFARALDSATAIDPRIEGILPSTKASL